jgi:hypothetical protein
MSDATPKPVRASRVTLSQLMHPEHANLLGKNAIIRKEVSHDSYNI